MNVNEANSNNVIEQCSECGYFEYESIGGAGICTMFDFVTHCNSDACDFVTHCDSDACDKAKKKEKE